MGGCDEDTKQWTQPRSCCQYQSKKVHDHHPPPTPQASFLGSLCKRKSSKEKVCSIIHKILKTLRIKPLIFTVKTVRSRRLPRTRKRGKISISLSGKFWTKTPTTVGRAALQCREFLIIHLSIVRNLRQEVSHGSYNRGQNTTDAALPGEENSQILPRK